MNNSLKQDKSLNSGSNKVTYLVLYGSLGVSFVLTLLLIAYDEISFGGFRSRTFIALFIIGYLLLGYYLVRKKYIRTTNWMLIVLYASLAFTTLLYWGLNSGIGIFATGFIIILSGILIGSRSIFPVAISVIILLCIVQFIHSSGIIKPDLTAISEDSSFLDVVSYATVLSIFALIAWISNSQMEKSLIRAKHAEKMIKRQKDYLAMELKKESYRLRQAQLKEVQQLYKFATLGQSTAATLHELSNHLSILNLDIDDLKQHLKNSEAIENAKEGIEQINLMVKQVRSRLDSYDMTKTFNAFSITQRAIRDQRSIYKQKSVILKHTHIGERVFIIKGDQLTLIQIITVLLHNALDACYNSANPRVTIHTEINNKGMSISVTDNGPGVSNIIKKNLFSPLHSSKPSGLGVGLYISKHLVESQFHGTIQLKNLPHEQYGAKFTVFLPPSAPSQAK